MRLTTATCLAATLAFAIAHPLEKRSIVNSTEDATSNNDLQASYGKPFAIFQPKMFVINMFEYEAQPWLESLDFEHNITIPGLSPLYPSIYCTSNYSVCEMTTGEGEINAAASVTALGLSPLFDLSHTYFLISGIGGGEPQFTTMGSVTFAKYAVQVALEYETAYQDFSSSRANWTSGYWAYGTEDPWTYPGNVYGTEVFEVNENLRDRAVELAETATLENGTDANAANRLLYDEPAARGLPSVVKCDALTSDNYFTGNTLGDYFSFYASMMTNGSATYCSTAQEDNASLEAFTRLHRYGLADYNRVVIMRSISDFTRPPPSKSNDTVSWFNNPEDGGSSVAFANLPIAGLPFVRDVLENWDNVYYAGKKYGPENYTGDLFNTLGGTPDFGKSSFDIA
ncbi:purine nucleoside permease [Metschnikowia bicuspidata var. bicuspidata NRRL YB-4993]|uniref:Purine nucleoside permease n=1 Tax=Metschnikowia bicuspidata var. bicuspidata NRRL YB-4993 TaxID=869754 RepID=A0A1A0HJ87_9ASCO|nr:purine nucleoside permease [Metschnikowia bicuspidata var. bicuspidata NRRL YB-4993]OBA23903.1 purine nucleoside permease [Metschnikowia bicuspidata var. bicuspidata NRRL YB-4993]